MSTSRKKQYQLMTEHGIVEKEDFTEVESLDFPMQGLYFRESRAHTHSLP